MRLEHGMSAHWGLLPVVGRAGGRKACADEIFAMATDCPDPLVVDVLPVRLRKPESAPELRLPKFLERGFVCGKIVICEVSHADILPKTGIEGEAREMPRRGAGIFGIILRTRKNAEGGK